MTAHLASENLSNVESHLFPGPEVPGKGLSRRMPTSWKFAPGSLDFVLVDGLYRDACALLSLDKIRPGGVAHHRQRQLVPAIELEGARSIRTEAEIGDDNWKALHRTLSGWRRIWTSDGVTDTAMFIKPAS